MRTVRPSFAACAAFAFAVLTATCAFVPGPARAQCSYPLLTDDTPQAFASTPQRLRFVQSAGRWACVAVQSAPGSNWDIGLSTGTAAFPTCLTLPVVASQQASGIDFVLGDFAAEGTGTRYAPIQRVSGAGAGTVEWDSGARTALVNGGGYNGGGGAGMLVDCWNVDLVGGTSYRIRFSGGGAPGDYKLYAFKRGATNSWRSKADALVEITNNLSSPPVLTATTTDRYAIVVVRETGTTFGYVFNVQPCVDPPHLEPHASLPVPSIQGIFDYAYQFEPGGPGFPTLAARSPQPGDFYILEVAKHENPGFYPCEGTDQAITLEGGLERVELLVGDQVTGAVTPGGSWWLGVIGATPGVGRVEYSPGTDVLAVDGATTYLQAGPDMVARTYRADLVAGTNYRFHVAKCGPATGRIYVFRPFDAAFPDGNGWSQPTGNHAPVAALTIGSVNDFTLTPTVTGAYAVVLTNETGENGCWELGIATCTLRTELVDRVPTTLVSDPPLPYEGGLFGDVHVRGGWSAVAVRPFALGENWRVEAYDVPTGGNGPGPFGCITDWLAGSEEDGIDSPTDFLARFETGGDARENVETIRIFPTDFVSPGGGAHALYEQWNVLYAIGDPPVQLFVSDPADLIEVVNVDLVAGQTYSFLFDPVGFAGEMFLFRPQVPCPVGPCPQEYAWPGSAGMQFRTTTTRLFTAPETATYGLVIVNQDGGTGKFWFAVHPTTVDAPSFPAASARTRFVGASPNPVAAASPARLEFELARPARVGFDIVNLAGRVVARVDDAPHDAGRGAAAWTPRGLAAGLYFARMRIDGVVVSSRAKLTVLP